MSAVDQQLHGDDRQNADDGADGHATRFVQPSNFHATSILRRRAASMKGARTLARMRLARAADAELSRETFPVSQTETPA